MRAIRKTENRRFGGKKIRKLNLFFFSQEMKLIAEEADSVKIGCWDIRAELSFLHIYVGALHMYVYIGNIYESLHIQIATTILIANDICVIANLAFVSIHQSKKKM